MKKNYIPTINISSILNNNFTSNTSYKIIKKIEKASIEVGFFQIIGHKLDVKKICNIGKKFFNSPKSNKIKLAPNKWNKKNKHTYRGYFPNDVNGKEGLDIGDLEVSERYSKKLNNQYIEYLNLNKSIDKQSIKALSDYFEKVFLLGDTLFKCILSMYGNDINNSKKVFSRKKTLSTLRFNYYPNQKKPIEISKQDGVALGCETHVDSGIFTILYQDKKGGLQVQDRKSKKWHNVPFNKKALVVNTGRALEFLTKKKFKATNHRVLWNKKRRMSVPFFFEPSYDFKMHQSFLKQKKSKNQGINYDKFLNSSLKKFIEYQR